ncbi:hypothetical protein GGU10DRAFT_122942 [Lentinula aff. detonsa]|uniref:Uncharacterized protein n=1 Tax=Lentinula aff. detonsa TaxID=2804958 RepID=A0AA38K805_9AGAR|nr:hypothetical protein GGU10DRAFT_122942 [Lentinula aff. detonsa]
MRSHRTLIPFIALALALAANAAPVLHPLGSHDSHTDLLHLKRTSLPQDLFGTPQFSTEVGSGDEDEQLSRRDFERRAKKKKKKNRQKGKQIQQQAAKAKAESSASNKQTSDGEHVAVPEGNQKEAIKPPQPANKTEGSAPTHAESSNSGSTNTEEKDKAKEEAVSVASHNDPKPGLSRVSTSSSMSSTSSHSSTSSCSSQSSQSSVGSDDPYSHDEMYGSSCEPVPHKPAVEDSGKQDKKTDEDKDEEKKKGKKKWRNGIAGASVVSAAALMTGGVYAMVKMTGSSESAFKSAGGTDGNEGSSSSSESSFDNVQFPGTRKRDINA